MHKMHLCMRSVDAWIMHLMHFQHALVVHDKALHDILSNSAGLTACQGLATKLCLSRN